MSQFTTQLHWEHGAVAIFILLLLLLSLLVAGKYRAAWLACLSVLCMTCVAGLWFRNRQANDAILIWYLDEQPLVHKTYELIFESSEGSIQLYYVQGIEPPFPPSSGSGVNFQWDRAPGRLRLVTGGRPPGTIAGEAMGFGLILESDPSTNPMPPHAIHFWVLEVPSWFVLLCLSFFPARWLYLRYWGRRAYARKHNLCTKCNYCLNGLPDPVRCPECGTARETAHSDRGLEIDRDHI